MNLGNLQPVFCLVDLLDSGWNWPLYGGIHVAKKILESKHSLCSILDEDIEISLQENCIVIYKV